MAKAMLGNVLVTKQTGAEGRLVSKLLVALAPNIQKELYLAVLLDRANSRPVIMASTALMCTRSLSSASRKWRLQ